MYKSKFTSPVDRIKANFSGWSGEKCMTCGHEITIAALDYSIKTYQKSLCRSCQSLEEFDEDYRKKVS